MLRKIKVTLVEPGQEFHHMNRRYVTATEEERKRHPGRRESVLAYQLMDKGDRIPVSFNPLCYVFIDYK